MAEAQERPGTIRQREIDAERARCNARADVQELRERVAAHHVTLRSKTDGVLFACVLDHVKDIDIAAQAILMEPRPQWVRTLIGRDLMRVHPRVGCKCDLCNPATSARESGDAA